MQKKIARMRHRYFVRTQYGVIKIKSLSYSMRFCQLKMNFSEKVLESINFVMYNVIAIFYLFPNPAW
ncbi:hypothetical protein [Arsenophonus endosymbiont of Bemisia tabaci]|uniref:hypothetical protein n=1 Tax=Arsenophonus endosymbiont of Bemisia tabaci TaxID=536059 RepID=UPI0015F69AA4|nr:hypothetical protein [Arsenophonus endosymbiont of Bemisia tabaci]CAA2929065.1 hypothetical protein ARSQ2_00129 [Arsenophonus endosymbiont of Bemisia tabaci Q2]